MTRHFLKDDDLTPAEQAEVLALAATLKKTRHTADAPTPSVIISRLAQDCIHPRRR